MCPVRQSIRMLPTCMFERGPKFRRLLRALLGFLQRVDAKASRMTPDNLSRVFAPTVLKREDPMDMMRHVANDAAFVRAMGHCITHTTCTLRFSAVVLVA